MSKKGVSSATVDRIRILSGEGYSANEQQRILKREHRGIRRTQLLAYVREFKGRAPKKEAHVKYTPHKYRGGVKYRVHYGIWDHYEREKHVTVVSTVHGIERKYLVSGTGHELADFVSDAVHYPPKKRLVRVDAGKIRDRAVLDRKNSWDRRPKIESEH